MSRPLLLLDVDGVLIRDRPLLDHVRNNVNAYVAHKLPKVKNPALVNKILYTKYGHTGRGLFDAFRIDTSDFNQKVYDRRLMTHLWDVLTRTEFQREAQYIHDLTNDWDVRLFSNAPLVWTGPVAEAISPAITIAQPGFSLKPDPRAYIKFRSCSKKIFVDDSPKNLRTATYFYNWTPVHFEPNKERSSSEYPTVGSLWEIALYANSALSF